MGRSETRKAERSQAEKEDGLNGSEIAVIAMSCRFPGAGDPNEFWRNLCGGVESLTRLTADDLRREGLDADALDDERYVPVVPMIEGIELFDAPFFGYTPLEAKVMDPQQRLFLECAWEAFEQGGYVPDKYPGKIGVFAGAKTNTYLFNLFSNREFFQSLDHFQIALGNDLACMATRVAHKFDLRGPSYAIHTACSTSLVAVHLACQSLLLGECDMALAGGAAINVPQGRGYFFQKGGILSPDGRCRTFDAEAGGSNFGNGVGTILLKRLEDALADHDHIFAIIRGSASNNDGARKASYTAPGVEGQTEVLLQAMACAGVEADTISYIEAHGTATELGDAIEMLALTEAFRASSNRSGFCAIGSVKTNIGHLETAAGIAGLIKTVLALQHRRIPPSLYFERPNPRIDFSSSPFYVNTRLAEWKAGDTPRRAGVSSFGIGSANAHVVLEEAPEQETSGTSRPWQLLLLSARSETALEASTLNLVNHLRYQPQSGDQYLADVAYTLKVGRKTFQWRRAGVCSALADVGAVEECLGPSIALTWNEEATSRQVVFMFPGLGDHYPMMGKGLYKTEPLFTEFVDRGAELLRPYLGFDIRQALYPNDERGGRRDSSNGTRVDFRSMVRRSVQDEPASALNRTDFIQPATFVIEYALAQLWIEWGVRPQAMIGYSLGEYVAACLSGVLSFEDAVELVATRARMIQELPAGAMLAVPLGEAEVAPLVAKHRLSLSAVNGPSVCVVSGPVTSVEAVERELNERQVLTRRLQTSHAFHSAMMDELFTPLSDFVRTIKLGEPRIPYISNVTGTWIRPEEAVDPCYWSRHMSSAVRFNEGIQELLRQRDRILLEVGPGQGLASFVKQHPLCDDETARLVVASLPGAYDTRPEALFLLETLGKLWLVGQAVDWRSFYAKEVRRRVPLATYPFERRRYWVDRPAAEASTAPSRVTLQKTSDIADWFYLPVWKASPAPDAAAQVTKPGTARGDSPAGPQIRESASPKMRWLVLVDEVGLGSIVAKRLREDGCDVTTARPGDDFLQEAFMPGRHAFTINPRRPEDYTRLLAAAGAGGGVSGIVHAWAVSSPSASRAEIDSFERRQDLGFYSLLLLAQALGRQAFSEPTTIGIVTNGLWSITGGEQLQPDKATMIGPARVIPQEFPRLSCRCVDVVMRDSADEGELESLADRILTELRIDSGESVVAYRGNQRWQQEYEPRRLEANSETSLRPQGVYLIAGGFGGLGRVLAEHLATKVRARLVLVGRKSLPDRAEWGAWLEAHGREDLVAKRIDQVMSLEELGAEVLAIGADVSSESEMRSALDEARRRFGAIHGVIHLAGIPGGGIIQLKTREMAEQILVPKIKGALVLDRLLRDEPLDFFVLYSSIASILGEFGQADYCGANAFLDAFAQRKAQEGGRHTVVINWDVWQEVGLAVYTEVPAHLRQWRQEMLAKGILNIEGVDAFDRILASGHSQVIVSAQDLPGRIELGKSFTGENFLLELQKASASTPQAHRRLVGSGYVAATGDLEQKIAEVWQRVLGADRIGANDNFFDLGGNSLLGLQLVSELTRVLGIQIAPVTLFEFPSISALARHLDPEPKQTGSGSDEPKKRTAGSSSPEIAIIGLAGRFPGAASLEEFWQNLSNGVESVTFFSDEELLANDVPRSLLEDPRYVKAGAILENIDQFDAALFGFSPREAEVTDPQHRIFLECAWEALETAGYDPTSYKGSIGVFAGSNLSTYLLRLYADPKVRKSVNMLQAILGNDKDSLTTMVSYKLNLRGPSMAVQTFCSTSLVAVHMACQSLRAGECDMALAGGIRVVTPDRQGYLYERGGLAPIDGHTRSFDAWATGSILGNGVGIVCLKRLEDALVDGDHIRAVIKGSAINNDGSLKAGYTAPSVAGQAEAIISALNSAGVDPESISYVEAHGSATELGDPIEVAALNKAFGRRTGKRNYCAIGSVKSNFGHLDRAAGVAALIKTVLALEHRAIPPTINFAELNPQIDLASPFYVNTALSEWRAESGPLRAGVNSLGMGGTNAHVVVEEAPPAEPSGESRPWQIILLSAKTDQALEAVTERLAAYLRGQSDSDLADVAHTLQVGRKPLEFRRFLVCRDSTDAATALLEKDPRRLWTAYREERECSIVFLFPGIGGQYVQMAHGLYEAEPAFKNAIDVCCDILRQYLGFDLRSELYPERPSTEADLSAPPVDLRRMLGRRPSPEASRIDCASVSQPMLFVVEYALAQLWAEWGIRPHAMVGYSLGEYVAACLAGVISLEDSLRLVAQRSLMIEGLPRGSLLAVGLSYEGLLPLLGEDLSVMAVNGPEQCVASGPPKAIEALQNRLASMGVAYRRLQASHAFHSRMMEPIRDSFIELMRTVELRPPQIPYISNVTGTWIRPEEATDPAYWANHMCRPVRFSDGVDELLKEQRRILIEVGPPVLSTLILQNPTASGAEKPRTLNLLRHSYETQPDLAHSLQALGKLWLLGVQPDWSGFYARERRRRVPLPTYPFQRQRYWIDACVDGGRADHLLVGDESSGECFYVPSWKRTALGMPRKALADESTGGPWWMLSDSGNWGLELADKLERAGERVTRLQNGDVFEQLGKDCFSIRAQHREDYAAVIAKQGRTPKAVVYLWGLPSEGGSAEWPAKPGGDHNCALSLFELSQSLQQAGMNDPTPVWIMSDRLHEVTGDEALQPEQASVIGACSALGREVPNLAIRNLDVVLDGKSRKDRLAEQVANELMVGAPERIVAFRGAHRWVPTVAVTGVAENGRDEAPDSDRVYLAINGLGPVGFTFCDHLAREVGKKLAFIEPSGFPPRRLWDEWLASDAGDGLISARIRRAQSLERFSEVVVEDADLFDSNRIRSIIRVLRERRGKIRGVLYFLEPEPASAAIGFSATNGSLGNKARSLLVLDEALKGSDLEFRLLVSQARESLTPDDCALNLFLDAFASQSARNGNHNWTSVSWEFPAVTGDSEDRSRAIRLVLGLKSIPHVIVSPEPLAEGWNKIGALLERSPAKSASEPTTHYPRPALRVEYVSPKTPVEQGIADIWRDLLGIEKVGVHDNFLDLGGDSLLAVRLISRMRDSFNRDLPIRLIFEASTIAELAREIEPQMTARDDADIAEIMSMLEGLSDEEVEQELLKRQGTES